MRRIRKLLTARTVCRITGASVLALGVATCDQFDDTVTPVGVGDAGNLPGIGANGRRQRAIPSSPVAEAVSGVKRSPKGGNMPFSFLQLSEVEPDIDDPSQPPISFYCGDGIDDPLTEECDNEEEQQAPFCSEVCQTQDVRLAENPAAFTSRRLGFGRHPIAGGVQGIIASYMEQDAEDDVSIRVSVFDDQGHRQGDASISDDTLPLNLSHPVAAALPDGTYAVAWTAFDSDGDELGIALRRVDPADPAAGSAAVANVTTAFSQFDADVLWDGSQLVVAWVDSSKGEPDLVYRTFNEQLFATSAETTLANTEAVEGNVALVDFNGNWAAAWRSGGLRADGGFGPEETIFVRDQGTGTQWSVGPMLPGPETDRPALVALDETHLLLVFTEGTDPAGLGIANIGRLRAVVLDTTDPGPVDLSQDVLDVDGLADGYEIDDLEQSQPNVVRTGTHEGYISWTSERIPGQASGTQLWLKPISWTDGGTLTLNLNVEELILPRRLEGTPGDQDSAALALAPDPTGFPSGLELFMAWTDYGKTWGPTAGEPEVLGQLVSLPLLRNETVINSSCSVGHPCGQGEGDCNSDEDCESGLQCGQSNGPQFGWGRAFGVCVPPHCLNNAQDGDEERVDCGGEFCGDCIDCPKGYSFGYCFDDPDLMLWMRSDDPAVSLVPGTELSFRRVVSYPNRAVPGGVIETVGANRNPRQTGYNVSPSTLFDENSRFSASVSPTTFNFLHTAEQATIAIAFKMPSVLPTAGQALLSTNIDNAGTGLGFTVSVGVGGRLDVSIGNGSQVALHEWADGEFLAGERYVLVLTKNPWGNPAYAMLDARVNGEPLFTGRESDQVMGTGNNTHRLTIGGHDVATLGVQRFEGWISEVVVYDRALTPLGIEALEYALMNRWECVETLCTAACSCEPPGNSCENDVNCVTEDACNLAACFQDQCLPNNHAPTGASCTDDSLCTVHDECDIGGACGGEPVDCTGIDQACKVGVCNPADGECSLQNRVDGFDCDDQDGVSCTVGSCNSGTCQPDPSKTVDDDECAGCGNANLARSGAVASSVLGSRSAAKAIDASTTTRWESEWVSDPQWIYVDLGADRHISTVEINWERASAKNYTIQVAPDGTCAGTGSGCLSTGAPWTTIYTSPTYATTNLDHRIDTIPANTVARYVRMHGTVRNLSLYGYSIWDFAVKGDSNSVCGTVCSPACGACATCSDGECVPKAAGTTCRATAGTCDTAETCNGTAHTCPTDGYLASGTMCRAAVAGGCDIAETCSGSSNACPVDAIAASGTACTDDGNSCTQDICNGASASCPRTAICVNNCAGQPDYTPFTQDTSSCTADVCIGGEGKHLDNGTCTCTCQSTTATIDNFNSSSDYGTASTTSGSTTTGITTPGGYALKKAIGSTGLTTHAADGQDVLVTAPASASSSLKIYTALGASLSSGSMAGYTTLRIRMACFGTDDIGCRNGFQIGLGSGTSAQDDSGTWYIQTLNNIVGVGFFAGFDKNHLKDVDIPLTSGTFSGLPALSNIHQLRITMTGGGATRNWRVDDISLLGNACTYPDSSSCGCSTAADCFDGNLCTTDACTGSAPNKVCGYTNLAAGTTCRAAVAGGCDVAETCAGGGAQCPADTVLSSGTSCRAAAGVCDVAETCNGVSNACPSDVKATGGTVCRAASGVCDATETCNGSSVTCPTDVLSGAGTVCRASVGGCDLAETCSGSTATCPSDALRPSGYVCRNSAGVCDPAETCSGSSGVCVLNALSPNGTVCRAAVPGGCDFEETCNGTATTCPADVVSSEADCATCGNSTLARVAAVASSVHLNGSNTATKAIDDPLTTNTRWESTQGVDPQWIYVDLGAGNKHISTVEIDWETASAKDYTISVAVDGTSTGTLATNGSHWTTLATVNDTLHQDHRINTSNVSGFGRYVRMHGTTRTGQYGYSIWDFKVKGDTNGVCGTHCEPACGACGTCSNFACVAKSAGTVCRTASDSCDAAETCNGSAQTCPTDVLAASGTVCRTAVAGGCDVAETCTGSSASCPADTVAASGVVCRVVVGSCDVAETCSGSSATCPSNVVLAVGTTCRTTAGACDTAETCNGMAGSCPTDAFLASGTVCRAAGSGGCDVAETCTGTGASCPADGVASSGTVCRTASGVCDAAETCNGSSNTCPTNEFLSGPVCRAAVAGGCDIAETCNGSSSSCPSDAVAASGTACTDDGNACTQDICNGSAASCPRTAVCVNDCTGQPDYAAFTPDSSSCTTDVCIGGVGKHLDNGTCTCTCQPTTATIDNFNSSSDYGTASTTSGSTTTGMTTPGGYALKKSISSTGGLTTHTADGQDVFVTAPASALSSIKISTALGSSLSSGSLAGYTTLRIRMACYGTDDVGCRNGFQVGLGSSTSSLGDVNGSWYTQTLNNIVAQNYFAGSTKNDLRDVDIPLTSGTFSGLPSLSNIHQLQITMTGGGATRNWRIDNIELRGGAGGNCTYPDSTSCGCSADADCYDGNLCTTDACTGTSPNKVCAYTNLAAGTTCRASAGGCDPAETCAGSGAQCPADAKQANGYVCRSAVAGGCDVQEVCNGVSNTCPTDAVQASGTSCRAAAGTCDVGETCNGTSNACPSDAKVAGGTICRASAGVCDSAETCNGSAAACPSDSFVSAGTSCRSAGGPCDVVENCSGSAATCPSDALVAGGTTCRAAVAGGCDFAETCNGSAVSCPADVIASSGTVCRAATAGGCDFAETCSGSSNACPTDVVSSAADCATCGNSALTRSGAVASSEYQSGPNTAAKAIDNPLTTNTRWESTHAVDPQWIYVDLGAGNKHISNVVIDWETASALDYTISVAVDGTSAGTLATNGSHWTTLATVHDATHPDHHTKTIDVSGVGRYVRMHGTTRNTQYGYSIWDFTVKGDTNGVCGTHCEPTCGACGTCSNFSCVAKAAGTVCRAAAGACDAEETCNGSAQTCPSDALVASGTVCRTAVSGGCDIAETCSGSATACPADVLASSGTVCRASVGGCDVAETCSGSVATCPSNTVLTVGTVCRASAGACDPSETCNGSAGTCPSDAFIASGTSCRSSAGPCDVAETCSGSAAACPSDALRASGYECRASAAACDAAETCNGSATSCPADALSPSGTVCRTAAHSCDIAETCNGSVNSCPSDALSTDPSCICDNDPLTRSSAVASSTQGSNAASRAIDSDTGTRWESVHASDPQWIYFDLGATHHVSSVSLVWEGASAKDYTIQVAPDGATGLGTDTPWTTIATKTNMANGARTDGFSVNGVGRYVRMKGTARTTQYGYSLYEFYVNGDTNSQCTP